MEPHESFVAELVFLGLVVVVLCLRCWVIRHQQRGLGDWVRDIFFATGAVLCIATTSCLAWYCWKSIEVYQQATIVVDRKIAEAARNSTVDHTQLTAAELAALQSKISAERESNIELLATVMLLDPWYRRFLFFMWGAYFTELWLLKGAFLAFYWRLFARVRTRFVYLLYGATIFVAITYIIVLTIHFTWCIPVHRNWTVPIAEFPGTSSIDSVTTLTVGSFLNISTDLMILILPLLVIQSFNLRRREKFGLCFIFLVGIICVTASVVRYVEMYLPFHHPPATIEGVRVAFFWSTFEVVTGFIAFCLPSFRLGIFRAIKKSKGTVLKRHRFPGLPYVSGSSSGGSSNPKHPTIGSSASKPKKKNLPRHPNTLLTSDFITLNTSAEVEERRDSLKRSSIVHPLDAKSPDRESVQIHIGLVHPEENFNFLQEPNGIQVTNTVTSSADVEKEGDTPQEDSMPYKFPMPPPKSLTSPVAAEDHSQEYALMPMQRAYDPSSVRAGSTENLRPTSKDRQFYAI